MANEKKKFKPSIEQLKYFQVFVSWKDAWNRTKLAEATGVGRTTLWDWEQNQDFNDWFYSEWKAFCYNDLPKIHAVLRKKALGGDIKALKMYLERFDLEYNPKSTVKHDVKFNEEESEAVKEMLDEDLKKL